VDSPTLGRRDGDAESEDLAAALLTATRAPVK
jgi:hypothetical protein